MKQLFKCIVNSLTLDSRQGERRRALRGWQVLGTSDVWGRTKIRGAALLAHFSAQRLTQRNDLCSVTHVHMCTILCHIVKGHNLL